MMAAMDRLDDMPRHWATRRGDAIAVRDAQGAHTWVALDEARESLAMQLADAGVRPGDRVVIVGENCALMVALLFALASLDAWIVNLNARLSAREVDAIRAHCGARCVLFLPDPSPDAATHAARHGAQPMAGCGWGKVLRSDIDPGCRAEPVEGLPGDRVAALVYTTGTTGDPKGVMLTHHNMVCAAESITTYLQNKPDDIILDVLPLSFDYGLYQWLMTNQFGGTLILEQSFN
jgi:acyl-CoA synthetase (AMP-forming)/AMP-acid ligase II